MKRTLVLILALLTLVLSSGTARAQNPDPRDYEVAFFVPSNTVISNYYFRQVSSSEGSNITSSQVAARGTWLLKVGDLAITPFDLIVPAASVTAHVPLAAGSPVTGTVHTTGLADLLFLPTIGYGIEQDPKTATHTWLALTTYITIPVGTFDPTRLVNIGRNRFAVQPQLVVGQRFAKRYTFELMANAVVYGTNNQFRVLTDPGLAGRDLDLTQSPSFGGSAHFAADLTKSFFVGGSYYLAINGEQETEIPQVGATVIADSTTVHTARLNLGHRITPLTVLLAQVNFDVAGSEGSTLSRFWGLRLSHVLPPTPKQKAPPAEG